jgi:hypothetical protein
MQANLSWVAALFAASALLTANKALAMARPVPSAPEIDGAAGIAVMALVASVVAVLFNRHRR